MIKDRYLHRSIMDDLKTKMVFIGGPRQVGKTTLAKFIGAADYSKCTYLNWDNREHRKMILTGEFAGNADLIIFDEIHKYKGWKNYIKGEYDEHKDHFHMLVTGSARLDVYRRGGDSLMGRYHYYRLHPFSWSESLEHMPILKPGKALSFLENLPTSHVRSFKHLLVFGGFPEPFLGRNDKVLNRFHNERLDRLIREDIRDIEALRDLSALQIMVELLPEKVGSLFSLNSLREDLGVAHKTIRHWTDVLERFYYHFRIYPFHATTVKSLRKEPKLYCWDWSEVHAEAARLENMVASHLLKMVHFLQDTEGCKTELWFLRDAEGREVDFLVTHDKKPWFCVEVKQSADDFSKHLFYFKKRLTIPFVYQVTGETGQDVIKKGVRLISADKFLTGLI
ncbi:ATP-binding protein [Candidatus Peregrinibacteria bacterium]|nr:ATP-binding protein [Candidatus Peregrinibacteria bacterium]